MSNASRPRRAYASDLSDEKWAILEPLIPLPRSQHGGRPREVNMREVINTILYLNRTGCRWDMLPHDLLPKSTAYEYFAQWRADGTWETVVDALSIQFRVADDCEATTNVGSVDNKPVKDTEVGGDERGTNGGKKIDARSRNLLVDLVGLLVTVIPCTG